MPKHAMIDLEMLGISPASIVLQIAGLKFNPKGKTPRFLGKFAHKLNLEEQERKYSRTMDDSTLLWWDRQRADNPDLYGKVFPEENEGMKMNDAMKHLRKWCADCDAFWAHGPLDFMILDHMFDQCSISRPWKFWQCFDTRSILSRCKSDPRKDMEYEEHDPSEDCRVQAECLQDAYRKFGFDR